MRILAAFVLAAALVSGCVATKEARLDATENTEVLEAVFRHVAHPEPKKMEDSHSLNEIHGVYFIAFWGSDGEYGDPNPRLLERFRGFPVPVKSLSAATLKDLKAFDKPTGERGAIFYFEKITYSGPHNAEVTLALAPGGGLSGSTFAYRVVRLNGRWKVTGKKLKAIA